MQTNAINNYISINSFLIQHILNISKKETLKKQVILQQATNTYPNKLKNFSKRPFFLFFKSILLAEASLSLLTKFNPDKQTSI